MAEPTLAEVFGANATQTATTITIFKADLPSFTASATNTAESILTAILLKSRVNLTVTNRTNNPDQSLAIEDGYDAIAYRGSTAYLQKGLTITFQKLNTSANFNANDY